MHQIYELLPLAQHQQREARRQAEQDRLIAGIDASAKPLRRNWLPYERLMNWFHTQGQRLRHAMETI